jgi:hypothetical protein
MGVLDAFHLLVSFEAPSHPLGTTILGYKGLQASSTMVCGFVMFKFCRVWTAYCKNMDHELYRQ